MSEAEQSRPSLASVPEASTSAGQAVISDDIQPHITSSPLIITYKGRSVKARIDRNVPIEEIVRQLCTSYQLNVQEPPALFALRDSETEELLTSENLQAKLDQGARLKLKLVSSPVIEAVETVEAMKEKSTVKLATFSLKNFVREKQFTSEFLARDGLRELVKVIQTATGNTLAYALESLASLMENDYGWEDLEPSLISRVVNILATQNLANVCRPATAIIRKLVTSSPSSAPAPLPGAVIPEDTIYCYGFDVVWHEIQKEPDFLSIVAKRLSSGDYALMQISLSLISSLIFHASAQYLEDLTDELEQLDVRKAVIRLMDNHQSDEISPLILQFQSNLVALAHTQLKTAVDINSPKHTRLLEEIWRHAKLPSSARQDGMKWQAIGFSSESPEREFDRVGMLGLRSMHRFAMTELQEYPKMILEQISRPEERRCPFAKTSNEVADILAEYFDFGTGVSASTSFQPLMVAFPRVHGMALRFFYRMWVESGATVADFSRVSTLVRSQVKVALRNETQSSWFEVEREFTDSDYREVRDRQMKELEIEDDLLSKAPVRNLRDRLYRESYEFVRAQRTHCLLEGGWFLNGPSNPLSPNAPKEQKKGSAPPPRMYRFYRLAPNRKHLHYLETADQTAEFIRGGVDDLPDRIDLSLVTDIVATPLSGTQNQAQGGRNRAMSISTAPHASTLNSYVPGRQPATTSAATPSLSISLVGGEVVLAELIAPDQATFSEWMDGLSLLRPGGYISTRETADLIQILTEIGVKVKLLDLSGERVEIPSSIAVTSIPRSVDFYYSDHP